MQKLFLLINSFIISFIICDNDFTFQTNLFNNLQKLTNNKLSSLTNYNYKKSNICISPISIYQIISLVSNGANGITQEEILQSLFPKNNLDKSIQIKLNLNNENILKLYEKNENIEIANAIMSKIPISQEFSFICLRYKSFYSILKNVEQVNEWCEEKTHGKIKKIIDDIKDINKLKKSKKDCKILFSYNK